MIRSPSFKPHFMPIRYGRASLISSSLFRLFASSFLLFLPVRFLRPLSGFLFQLLYSRVEVLLTGSGKVSGNVPLPLSFFHMVIPSSPVHHHDAPVGQTAAAPINFLVIPCQQAGEHIKHRGPHGIHQLAGLRYAIIRYLQVIFIKADAVFMQPVHGGVCFFLYGYGKSPLPSAISHRRRKTPPASPGKCGLFSCPCRKPCRQYP